MELILEEDFPMLGFVGDRVVVKNGYARNFLIPRGIASEVSSRKARELEHKLAGINAKKKRLKEEAEKLGTEITGVPFSYTIKLGEQGKSFGSITNRDLQATLEQKGYTVERRQIKLAEPIKAAGTYTVSIQLHSEVAVDCTVTVEAEELKKAPKEDRKGKKRTRNSEDEELQASEAEGEELTAEEQAIVDEEAPQE